MNSALQIEVLCATMNQHDFSKLTEMNIQGCSVAFANQAKHYDYQDCQISGNRVQMLTTATIGVGKNRNLALVLASGDILVFADDDMRYEEDAFKSITEAFSKFPEADAIIFGLKYQKSGKVYRIKLPKTGKLSFIRALRYGTAAFAIRRTAVLKYNLHFSELFGGGCLYSYGEDSDFIIQCFKKGVKIYTYRAIIATTNKDSSTCFSGYHEKYYFDKGAFARHSLGIIAFPYILRMAIKKTDSELHFFKKLYFLWSGYKSFQQLLSYENWKKLKDEKNHNCKQ